MSLWLDHRCGVGLAALALAVAVADPAAAFAARRFQIPAQPLDQALAAFSAATGLPMLYDSALAADRRSAAVSGEMQPREALVLLLAGTGLSARFTQGGAVVIYAGSGSAVALNPITATAAPVIGRSGEDPAARAYAESVQRQIVERLRSDPALSSGDYVVSARFWVDDVGAARRVEVITGSGDQTRDRAFLAAASAMLFPVPPPNLPQPMRMEFRVRHRP
ncbi:STN domain-containing protein [Caulobacter mirabilis]|uniref:Secretin/TonB short N-terminal domain-containing protein n=1 Tax=Caulobacter mirabilis TaxID=69666 RepID=A0A2D2B2V7_9CAUL|nr:STN domain-containing protein [Caulobacter mirabilis]ATQ44573.1 hypothetical protein CSW64_20355 [Caulobacter mirabilis]